MGDEGDRFRLAARAGQRVHHIEAGRVDDDHGQRQARLEIGAVGAARDHHVRALGAGGLDLADDVLEAACDDAQLGAVVVFGGDIEEQVAQAADAAGPDAGAKREVGGSAHGGAAGRETGPAIMRAALPI